MKTTGSTTRPWWTPDEIRQLAEIKERRSRAQEEMDRLAPCPFVASHTPALSRHVDSEDPGDGQPPLYWVQCGCGAQGPHSESEAGAIRRWETRAQPDRDGHTFGKAEP